MKNATESRRSAKLWIALSLVSILAAVPAGATQDQDESPAPKVVDRELRKRSMHVYRVILDSDREGDRAHMSYYLSAKCSRVAEDKSSADFDLRFSDYTVSTDEGDSSARKVGGGLVTLGKEGLPSTLIATISEAPYWIPMLTWYLPETIADGDFKVNDSLGAGEFLAGTGSADLAHNAFSFNGAIKNVAGEGPYLILNWRVDSHGWLIRGEGAVTDAGGTITFKISST